jgi:ADP-ribose pyrophosphatase
MTVSQETVRLQDGRVIDDYYQIAMGRAAVIAAMTSEGKVVLLRMYKHGPRRSGIGFPGGGVEAGETALDAAQRELREETGYSSSDWQDLGGYAVHSNQGCGYVTFFAAFGCEKTHEATVDDLEQHELLLASVADVKEGLSQQSFLSMGHACMAGLWLNALAQRGM